MRLKNKIKRWYKYTFKRTIRVKTKKAIRNIKPRPYVEPRVNIYNRRIGPYVSNAEFDASFDEIPEQLPIGGALNIVFPSDN